MALTTVCSCHLTSSLVGVDPACPLHGQSRQQAPLPMNKRQFLQQYVIGRTYGNAYGLNGRDAVTEAIAAWNAIEKECGQ